MSDDSVSIKLQKLFDLFKAGALSKDEYNLLKSELLNGVNIPNIDKTEPKKGIVQPTLKNDSNSDAKENRVLIPTVEVNSNQINIPKAEVGFQQIPSSNKNRNAIIFILVLGIVVIATIALRINSQNKQSESNPIKISNAIEDSTRLSDSLLKAKNSEFTKFILGIKNSAIKGVNYYNKSIYIGQALTQIIATIGKPISTFNGEWNGYYVYKDYSIGINDYIGLKKDNICISFLYDISNLKSFTIGEIEGILGKPKSSIYNLEERRYNCEYNLGKYLLVFSLESQEPINDLTPAFNKNLKVIEMENYENN